MVDGSVLSELLKEKLDCKFKRVRVYDGPLAQKRPQWFHNFCEGIGKGVVNGSSVIQFTTLDAGLGGAPPVPGIGVGVGIIIDVDWFTENLYKELRAEIINIYKKTNHPAWCDDALAYSPLIGTWRMGDMVDGVDLIFDGHMYEINGYGSDTSSGSGTYSWDAITKLFNRCEISSSGWDFPDSKNTKLIVKDSNTKLEIYADSNLYDTFERVGAPPAEAPPGHCSLKPNQYNKYNFLTALSEGISESIAEHYEQMRDLNSTHPMVYMGIGLINEGMFFGVMDSNVKAMIIQEGHMMKGPFWEKVAEVVARVYMQAIHTKSTGEVTITGTCASSQSQACGLPMIGTGSGTAT